MTLDEVRAVKERQQDVLLAIPHVVGVGIGKDEAGFHVTVYLESATDVVPSSLDGVPVVTRITGRITAVARPAFPAEERQP